MQSCSDAAVTRLSESELDFSLSFICALGLSRCVVLL